MRGEGRTGGDRAGAGRLVLPDELVGGGRDGAAAGVDGDASAGTASEVARARAGSAAVTVARRPVRGVRVLVLGVEVAQEFDPTVR
ncbi:hypothetical protein [Actinacidiphila sp. bgisy160]|uniref:hypothetical protein n=1 Tax=Actinacidiphila sp. bgisy160 TaxID=3413796 RepID=UPI003D754814